MSDPVTNRCGLPLLQPAQAQKHVTVNEALMRLDGLTNLVLESVQQLLPPADVVEGACFGLPSGVEGEWAGKNGRIAIAVNGGWVFAKPQPGQRGFVRDQGASAVWDGSRWRIGAITLGSLGAGLSAGLTEAEVPITSGTAILSDVILPANVLILGVGARVIEPITGTLTSWQLGVADSAARFGSGMGLARDSYAHGLLSAPMANYSAQKLRFGAVGGAFVSGRVRVAVHWLELHLPDAAS